MSNWFYETLKDLFSPIEIGHHAKKMSDFDENIFELILSANKEFYGKFFPHIKTQADWDIHWEKEIEEYYYNWGRDGRGYDKFDDNNFEKRFTLCLFIKDKIERGEVSPKGAFRKMYDHKSQSLKIKYYKQHKKRWKKEIRKSYKNDPLSFKQHSKYRCFCERDFHYKFYRHYQFYQF